MDIPTAGAIVRDVLYTLAIAFCVYAFVCVWFVIG